MQKESEPLPLTLTRSGTKNDSQNSGINRAKLLESIALLRLALSTSGTLPRSTPRSLHSVLPSSLRSHPWTASLQSPRSHNSSSTLISK